MQYRETAVCIELLMVMIHGSVIHFLQKGMNSPIVRLQLHQEE
jgi:hypothetical protein